MTPEEREAKYTELKAHHEARRRARRIERGLDPDEESGEFMVVGPDGEMSDLQMHAEILQEDDLLEAADQQRKQWAARRKEIAQARAEGREPPPAEKWRLAVDDNGKVAWQKSNPAPDKQA